MRTFIALIVVSITLPALALDPFPDAFTLYVEASPFVVEWDEAKFGYFADGDNPRVQPFDPIPASGSLWTIDYLDLPTGMGIFDGGAFNVVDSAGGLYSTSPPESPTPEPAAALAVIGITGAVLSRRRTKVSG